jgi:serine/threonine-protein kinase RsbW
MEQWGVTQGYGPSSSVVASKKISMPSETYREVAIASAFHQAKKVEDGIVMEAMACGYDEEAIFALRLSLEEALTNAIRHGNAGDVNKKVLVRYTVNRDMIDIYVSDEGQGFNPEAVPDPTQAENLESPTGRGIMLMRAYMNEVEYNEKGNTVHMIKRTKGCQGS